VNTVLDLRVPRKMKNLFCRWRTISLSRTAALRVVILLQKAVHLVSSCLFSSLKCLRLKSENNNKKYGGEISRHFYSGQAIPINFP
jgi:hypothetical protein